MSTKTDLQTEMERLTQSKHLQNAIQTVLEMEQSFKLYSFRIIDTTSFVDGINSIMERYANIMDKINQEHEELTSSESQS